MTTLVLININVHTKFEMPSFTHSKDIIKTLKLKKIGHMTLITPIIE